MKYLIFGQFFWGLYEKKGWMKYKKKKITFYFYKKKKFSENWIQSEKLLKNQHLVNIMFELWVAIVKLAVTCFVYILGYSVQFFNFFFLYFLLWFSLAFIWQYFFFFFGFCCYYGYSAFVCVLIFGYNVARNLIVEGSLFWCTYNIVEA